jgi:hypothetical protein
MYARTSKCSICAVEMYPGQCCSVDSACGSVEFNSLVDEVKQGMIFGSGFSQIQEGPYRGQVDVCLNCQRYVDNDRASEPDCPGWAAMGGQSKEDLSG